MLGRRAHPRAARLPPVPGHRQWRLHQPAHPGAPGLRRRYQRVPARQPGRAHRPGHPVPEQLQPRFRAQVREHQGGPGHDRAVGHRERPAGRLHLRPAHLPGRPARAERPQPRRARGVADQPGRRPEAQPAAARLLAGTAQHPHPAGRAGRHAVPGQQAGDHPRGADREWLGVHRDGQLHRQAGRAQRRGRHHGGLVPRPRRRVRDHRAGRFRGLDAAQRLPGGQAHLRLLRHGERRQDRARQRHAGLGQAQPGQRRVPRRLGHLELALPGAGRQLPGRGQRGELSPDRAGRRQRHQVLRGPGRRDPRDAAEEEPGDHEHAAEHHRVREPVQRQLPVHLRWRRRRHPAGQLRRRDADDDHVRGRVHRHRRALPREHAPVVG